MGFRKWRESTSTSPSGRHLGHYKALLRAELEEENEDDTKKTKNKKGNIKTQWVMKFSYQFTTLL